MVDDINSWLNTGCNFQQGAGLYARYGTDQFFIRLLDRGESPLMRDKLVAKLTALREDELSSTADNCGTAAISPVASQVSAVPDLEEPSQPAPSLPPIMSIKEALKKNYGELTGIHPHLQILPEGEELRLLAVRVLRLGKQNAELWERYNYYTENPDALLPGLPPPPAPVMIDANLLDKRELLRKSLNKAENRIKGVAKPKTKTLELIAKRRQELADLDAHIAQIRKDQEK